MRYRYLTPEMIGDAVLPAMIVDRALGLEIKGAAAPAPQADTTQKSVSVPFQIKADSIDEEARTFSGLASTWDLDLGGDVIHKGAFKKTLKDWKRSKAPMPLLDSHNAWSTVRAVIGKMEEADETDAGLEAKFSVIDGPDGDEIWRRIKGGFVSGLSIGYRPVKIEMPNEDEERAGVWRHLKEVALREVSVVLYPMNPGARIDAGSMKASIEALKKTAAERALTAAEKAELTELQATVKTLLETGHEPKEGAITPEDPEPEPAKELAVDDPARVEMDRKLAEARLRAHGTRARRSS